MTGSILIIDDNEQDQKIIRRYLAKAGFKHIAVAADGQAGIKEALRMHPAVVLVDTVLPGIDGFETCRRLTGNKEITAHVIMMTGRVDAVDADKAQQAGAVDYCVKTADCGALLASLKKVSDGTIAAAAQPVAAQKKDPVVQWGLEKTNAAIKTLYRELEKKNMALQELDTLKSQFVATVSHELRTPLTVIKGAVSQLLDGTYGEMTDEQKRKLAMALKEADALRRIIDDILDLSKLQVKKGTLHKKAFDIVALVQEAQTSLANLAQGKGLALTVALPDAPLEIVADYDRITQVFTNLIGNAIKFTDTGSITVSVEDRGEEIVCAVSDTGCGIAADDMPKVFGRFQQFGKKDEAKREGTGLGLSICKDIVELHGGTIFVHSQLNKGSTFTFTIPKK